MAKLTRRKINNILILFILFYITLCNLPSALDYFSNQSQENERNKEFNSLFPSGFEPSELRFSTLVLYRENMKWHSSLDVTIPIEELVSRWLNLTGTYVDTALFNKLEMSLFEPKFLFVEDKHNDKAYRIIYYQTPKFWLLQNWQKRWIAVSVDPQYLMPVK